jgi:hypothetical protein
VKWAGPISVPPSHDFGPTQQVGYELSRFSHWIGFGPPESGCDRLQGDFGSTFCCRLIAPKRPWPICSADMIILAEMAADGMNISPEDQGKIIDYLSTYLGPR